MRYGIAALLLSLLLRGRSPDWPVRLRLWAIGGVFVVNSLAYFVAAFVFASYIVISSRFAADVPAPMLAQHLAQTSAVVSLALALASGGIALPVSPRAWLPVVGIAVVSTVIALLAFLAGMALIGPTRASVLSSLEVIVTLSVAFVLLGERLGPRQWAGAALILGAVAWQNAGALRGLRTRRQG